MADSLYKKAVPAHIRTFVETLAGKKDPITEKDFTAEELEQIRAAVRSAQSHPTIRYSKKDPKGTSLNVVGYEDYDKNQTKRADLDLRPSAAARNTLGRFRFQKTPDGRTIAIDTYDFEDDLAGKGIRSSAEYEGMSTAEKIATLAKDTLKKETFAPFGSLPSRVGSAFIGKKGRPVSIDLGEGLKKGGTVKAKKHRGDGIAQRGKTKGKMR
jgi:hypothetical protein